MSDPIPKSGRPSFLQLIYPFWLSGQKWKALAMLAIVLGIGFGRVYLMVLSNRLDGQVMDAMVGRDWTTLWPLLALALLVGVATVIAVTLKMTLFDLLVLRWRTWMTHRYLHAWTSRNTYYDVEREGRVGSADQRIAQDVASFVHMTLDHVTGVVFALSNTVTFTLLLWQLGGTLTFTAFGRAASVPGYQVWLVYLDGISVVLIAHLFGRQLVRLFNRRQEVEADFRFLGMRLRENAEQIAFYGGGRQECRRLEQGFEQIRGNTFAIVLRTCKMTLVRDVYVQSCSILPTLASLPRYLSGAISLGTLTRTVGAFNSVRNSLSWWYQAYINFAEWVAIANRLRDLSAALAEQRREQDGIHLERRAQAAIVASGLRLRSPSGALLARVAPLQIAPGERWLLCGASGSGKSTLLRVLAGLWPHGDGMVVLPRAAVLMFLPQRSYIPAGTLKAALCYPAEPERFGDADCQAVLHVCGLAQYADALHGADHWQQRLSGGEQQRLAIARALLHKPDFLFLDEATSALDPSAEWALYTALLAQLPGTALVSVAHRRELDIFHEAVLEIEGESVV